MSREGDILRAAAEVLRKHHWRNEREVADIEVFADEVDVATTPVPKTREEQADFARAWDAKVEAGRVGSEVKTRSGTFPSIPYVRQEDGTWKPKYV